MPFEEGCGVGARKGGEAGYASYLGGGWSRGGELPLRECEAGG